MVSGDLDASDVWMVEAYMDDVHIGFLVKLEWKPLVKMKIVVDISFGVKVWDTLFYLPSESNARASCIKK